MHTCTKNQLGQALILCTLAQILTRLLPSQFILLARKHKGLGDIIPLRIAPAGMFLAGLSGLRKRYGKRNLFQPSSRCTDLDGDGDIWQAQPPVWLAGLAGHGYQEGAFNIQSCASQCLGLLLRVPRAAVLPTSQIQQRLGLLGQRWPVGPGQLPLACWVGLLPLSSYPAQRNT